MAGVVDSIGIATANLLKAIDGTEVNYPKPSVRRFHKWDATILQGHELLYTLVPDEDEPDERASKSARRIFRMDLILARKFKEPGNAELADGAMWAVQSGMYEDVDDQIRNNVSLGGYFSVSGVTFHNLDITLAEFNPELTFIAGWAVVFLRLAATYTKRYQ